MAKLRLAILASGSGSNAEAIMKWAETSDVAEVVCVLSDKKNAPVLERAERFGVPNISVKKKKNESKSDFDLRLLKELSSYEPDWIILAGFMRILTPAFLAHYPNRIVNIHPSLLPLFPGLDGYGEAFKADVLESGCSVHFVDEGVDTGEIIAQQKFKKIPGEDFESFKKRGLELENQFYPQVLEKLFTGKI